MPRDATTHLDRHFYKRIFMVPGRMLILMERNISTPDIPRRPRLPGGPQSDLNGYSTGHWDGDHAVIETTASATISGWMPLEIRHRAGQNDEHIRRPNFGTLELEITINDPKAYTAPWTVKLTEPWFSTAS